MQHTVASPNATGNFLPYSGILAECRDLIRKRACELLLRACGEIEEELQTRRIGASAEETERIAEALQQLHSVRTDLDRQFSATFEQQFQHRTRSSSERKQEFYGSETNLLTEISLVAEEEIDDALTIQSLADRLRKACEGELQELEPRIALMLGKDEIDSTSNPVGTTAICETLKEVCWGFDSPREVREMLLDMFVRRLGGELSTVFKEANSLLVTRRVMPRSRTRPKVRKSNPAMARLTQRDTDGDATGQPAGEPAELIQRLFSGQAGNDWSTRSSGGQLLQALTRLQTGDGEVSFGNQSFSVDPEVLGTTNVLGNLIEAGFGKQLEPVDGMVIDVVATLFDYIFDDKHVPAAMKGLIGRLQIPVLKLAMLDHSFFSNRSHPARRLINALAQSASTWDGEFTNDCSLYRTAEALVLRIQNEFAQDAGVFAACDEAFQTYLAEEERRLDEKAASLTGRLEQRERHELATTVARDAIAVHLANPTLPTVVKDFLQQWWIKVLVRASLHPASNGEAWRVATDTMDELVWSVLSKSGVDERKRLVQLLPTLLKRLKAGVAQGVMDEAAADAFFAELVKLHTAAIKSGMSGADSGEPPPTVQPMDDNAPQASPTIPPHPVEEETPPAEDLERLSRGSWIELRDESGEVRRMRLTWVSPARTTFLFANRQGQRALALTQKELSRRFAKGEATITDGAPLLDRFVDEVMEEL